MFRFCRFIKVTNSETLINSLSNVWIRKLRLHANVARFDRKVDAKPSHARAKVVTPVLNNYRIVSYFNKATSYVNVAKAYFNSSGWKSLDDGDDANEKLSLELRLLKCMQMGQNRVFGKPRKYRVLEVMFGVKKGFPADVSTGSRTGGSIQRIQLMDMAY
ncbi:hypothetical protein Tco_1261953 [Tanacetum coccineum]